MTAHDPFLMLTAAGVLQVFADPQPPERLAPLQGLLAPGAALRRSEWVALAPGHADLLEHGLAEGLIHESGRALHAPETRLDDTLPHLIGGLSGRRLVALALGDGFCLSRVGYDQETAEALCAAAADFLDFSQRQRVRGWNVEHRAVSFHLDIDVLMPATTFLYFWVDGTVYALVLGGEPLVNNPAFVELVWGIKSAGRRFSLPA